MSDIQINQILDIHDRGLHYGDGLFETLLKQNADIRLWSSHYNRLRKGCAKLSIPAPDEEWLLEKIKMETCNRDTAVVKIILTRGVGGGGIELPENNQASVFVLSYPYTAIADDALQMDTVICRTRLPINPNLAGIKHLNRLDYVLAAVELSRLGDVDEAILCDTEGYLVEGIISNLFFCLQGEVYTPSLEFSGVDGIMRQQILKHLDKQGIAVRVGRYYPELLLRANECFLCNSVRGVRPIRSIDGAKFSTGSMSQMLIQTFNTHNNPDSLATD